MLPMVAPGSTSTRMARSPLPGSSRIRAAPSVRVASMSFGTALASTMGLGVAATTAAVGALVGDSSMPSSSLSETVTLRVLPTSAATGGYSLLPASSISAPERSHWYSNTAAAISPVDAVRVSPTWAARCDCGGPGGRAVGAIYRGPCVSS